MSHMQCKCGEILGTSLSPSPYNLSIYYEEEINNTLSYNKEITLNDFLLEWDDLENRKKEFITREEPVEYWFCPVCKRVYEVQAIANGRWLRTYKQIEDDEIKDYSTWKRIYVLSDISIDLILEETPNILLLDYINNNTNDICYYISKKEDLIVAVNAKNQSILFTYKLEDSIEK